MYEFADLSFLIFCQCHEVIVSYLVECFLITESESSPTKPDLLRRSPTTFSEELVFKQCKDMILKYKYVKCLYQKYHKLYHIKLILAQNNYKTHWLINAILLQMIYFFQSQTPCEWPSWPLAHQRHPLQPVSTEVACSLLHLCATLQHFVRRGAEGGAGMQD